MTRLALAMIFAVTGCAGGRYEAYRAQQPEWDGAFPTGAADVKRTVAALYAPGRGYAETVTQLWVWRLPEWAPVDADAILRSAASAAAGDYAVVASLSCASNDGTTQFMRVSVVWFLLPENRLTAWDHDEFKPGCAVTNRFEPARGALVETERALLKHAGLPLPAGADGATEYYQKGLVLLRAGRRDDATAMLTAGDSSGEGGFGVRARFNAPHSDSGESRGEARAALVRELGGAQ
ncbi:MAG: hypothetical protein ACHQ6T_06725 [Myxococcota bacterium]